MQDRRKERRRAVREALLVWDNRDNSFIGQVADMTQEGVMLVCRDPIAPETILYAQMTLPFEVDGFEFINLQLECRRCEPSREKGIYRVGFRFQNLLPESRKVLSMFIQFWRDNRASYSAAAGGTAEPGVKQFPAEAKGDTIDHVEAGSAEDSVPMEPHQPAAAEAPEVENSEPSGDKSMQDRRKQTRKLARDFLFVWNTADDTLIGQVADLSMSGMLLLSKKQIRPGTSYHCRISLPEAAERRNAIELQLESRWCRINESSGIYHIGCEFVGLPREAKAALTKLISSMKKKADVKVPV